MVRSERLNGFAEKASGAVIEFVVYAFIGWAYETIFTSIVWEEFADRGWLHLPLCPIYGFCAFFLIFVLGRIKNIPLVFIAGTLVTTAAELAVSYIIEFITHESFDMLWDYYEWKFNFEGRIALGSSLIFGVMCVLLIKLLHPLLLKLTGKMNFIAKVVTAAAIICAVAVDSLYIILN